MMRRMSLLRRTAMLLAGLAVLVAGCRKSDRPPLGAVTGTVTLDGSPLASAAVTFTPAGAGRTSLGTTDAAGRYALTYLRDIAGANIGRHAVRITTASEENGGKEALPAKYNSASGLSADVKPGANTIDFSLESK